MMVTMADYVSAVQQDVPDALVSAQAIVQILTLAKSLPPCRLAGFECRLAPDQLGVDFQVEVSPASFNSHPNQNNQSWAFFQSFYNEWIDETSVLSKSVNVVGLEFDVRQEIIPSPGIFVALSRTAIADTELLLATIARLMGRRTLSVHSPVHLCIKNLPKGAKIKFIGTMRSRVANPLRVNIYGLAIASIVDFLQSLHWQYPTEPLLSIVDRLSKVTDVLVLCLDFTDRLLPKIGIECILYKQPPDEPRWEQLLSYLNTLEVCSDAKHRALLSWHGDTVRLPTTKEWPSNLDWGDRLLGRQAISTFFRYISHLKLVYEPGHSLEAKAYLGFLHQWLSSADVVRASAKVDDVS